MPEWTLLPESLHQVTDEEAGAIIAGDRESHQRDLDQAIEVSRAGCSRS